jgi:hypothetical protein
MGVCGGENHCAAHRDRGQSKYFQEKQALGCPAQETAVPGRLGSEKGAKGIYNAAHDGFSFLLLAFRRRSTTNPAGPVSA